MSVWTDSDGTSSIVRRSSRRLNDSDSNQPVTPMRGTPRKLLIPKSSLIPKLKVDEEVVMISSEEDDYSPTRAAKKTPRGRGGRPPKGKQMTTSKADASSPISSPASSGGRRTRATRSSSRSRSKSPSRKRSVSSERKTRTPKRETSAKVASPVLTLEDDAPVLTRRSSRLAKPSNGAANGGGLLTIDTTTPSKMKSTTMKTPAPDRSDTQWIREWNDRHPFLSYWVIPFFICLIYATIIYGVFMIFGFHHTINRYIDKALRYSEANFWPYWDNLLGHPSPSGHKI